MVDSDGEGLKTAQNDSGQSFGACHDLYGSVSTNHGYISDILARRKEEKKVTVYWLNVLGWTQKEIGNVIDVSQSTLNENYLSGFPDLKKTIKTLILEGHPHPHIAERYNMPVQLVWAIGLEGKTDQQRISRINHQAADRI